MERQMSELSNKVKTLSFRRSKTSEVLKKRDRQACERQKQSIINISKAVNELKETIEVKGNVRATLDKLKGIKGELVQGHNNWQNWGYEDLLRSLKTWHEINPVEEKLEKLNFPQGYLPEGEMWFSEYLRGLVGAILVQSRGSSGLVPTITFSACALSSSDGVQAEVL